MRLPLPPGLSLLAGILCAAAASRAHEAEAPLVIDLDRITQRMSEPVRRRVRPVLEKPTLHVRGPAESFTCQPALYHWFLEHPDQAVKAWRRMGARCIEIVSKGDG